MQKKIVWNVSEFNPIVHALIKTTNNTCINVSIFQIGTIHLNAEKLRIACTMPVAIVWVSLPFISSDAFSWSANYVAY